MALARQLLSDRVPIDRSTAAVLTAACYSEGAVPLLLQLASTAQGQSPTGPPPVPTLATLHACMALLQAVGCHYAVAEMFEMLSGDGLGAGGGGGMSALTGAMRVKNALLASGVRPRDFSCVRVGAYHSYSRRGTGTGGVSGVGYKGACRAR